MTNSFVAWIGANAVSIVGAVAAMVAAFFSWKNYRHNVRRSRRKPLTVEPAIVPVVDQPAWRQATLTIRNLEPFGARILAVGTRGTRAKLLLGSKDLYHANDRFMTRGRVVNPLPTADTVVRAGMEDYIAPFGTEADRSNAGAVRHVVVFVHGDCQDRDLYIEWRWADGHRD